MMFCPRNKTHIGTLSVLLFFMLPKLSAEPGQELGRVFLSPAERTELNKERIDFYAPPEIELVEELPIVEEHVQEPVAEESVGPALLVNGFVKRAGTSGTVWINGESTYDGDMANLNVDHLNTKIVGKKVKVAPLDDQAVVYLKPGQGFIPEKREITTGYRSIDAAQSE